MRCHPAKLLLDPYARALTGSVTVGPEVLGYSVSDFDAGSEVAQMVNLRRLYILPWSSKMLKGGLLRLLRL